MKSSDGIKAKCEYVSSDYISVNNCGHIASDNELYSSRPNGRADYTVIYVTDGSGFCHLGEEKTPFKKGDLIVWRPMSPLTFGFDGPSSHYWLHFTGSGAEALLARAGINGSGLVHMDHSAELIRLFRSIIFELQMNRTSTPIICEGYLLQLIAAVCNSTAHEGTALGQIRESKIYPALEAMMSDYTENRQLSHYAELCNMSLSHFKAQFKTDVQMSPTAYLIKLKTEHAKNILRFTNLSISEAAYSIGFRDPLYFSRFFKKHIGVSPKKYREEIFY